MYYSIKVIFTPLTVRSEMDNIVSSLGYNVNIFPLSIFIPFSIFMCKKYDWSFSIRGKLKKMYYNYLQMN